MLNQSHRHRLPGEKGFTLVEMLIASSVSLMAFGMCAMAVVGFQYQGRATYGQLQMRLDNQSALEKMGRRIMQASKMTVEQVDSSRQIVHLWHDDQVVWTPATVADDTEGVLYLEPDTRELRYRPNITHESVYDVVAKSLDRVTFSMAGNALFIKMTMSYDAKTTGTDREILASYVVRNNPKIRLGASN
jgi:type II secretory pathway component PulJ